MGMGQMLIATGLLMAAFAPFRPADTAAVSVADPPPKPVRVMSLNQCTDQLLLALLPPARITSVTWLSKDPGASLMWREAAQVGTNYGQSEEVIAQTPDLVITGDFTTPVTRAFLKRLGYPLIEVPAAHDFDDIRAITRRVGQAVGEPERAEALIARMDAILAAVTPLPTKLRVIGWNGGGYVQGEGTLFDAILAAAGARNAAAEADAVPYGTYDMEALIQLAPDVLIQSLTTIHEPTLRLDVARHPVTRAVYRGRTIALPAFYETCGTPESAAAVIALHAALKALTLQGISGPPIRTESS